MFHTKDPLREQHLDSITSSGGHRTGRDLAAVLLGLLFLTLVGCNTFGGFGKDVESAGDAIADTNEGTED